MSARGGGISAASPPVCRRKSAGFAHRNPLRIHRFSALSPHDLHTIFMIDSHRISDRIFLSLFEGNPEELADSANQKKGEREAVLSLLRKTSIGGGCDDGNDHYGLWPGDGCTQDVARGTVIQCAVSSGQSAVQTKADDLMAPRKCLWRPLPQRSRCR